MIRLVDSLFTTEMTSIRRMAVSPVGSQPWRYPQPWKQLGKVGDWIEGMLVSLWEHIWQLK